MLSLIVHMKHLKFVLPAAVIFGTVPQYFVLWAAWRFISLFLPSGAYERGDDVLYSVYQKLILLFYEHYSGVEVYLYGDHEVLNGKKENILYMSNHQSSVDWVVSDLLADRQGSLGHLRYVLKDQLKYIPMYGWYFSAHGGVYVKRTGGSDGSVVEKHFNNIRDKQLPVWLVIFPEGTRYNIDRRDVIHQSQQFASKNGLPVLEHCLSPRTTATLICLQRLRDHFDAVYDVTIAYSHQHTHQEEAKDRTIRKSGPGLFEFFEGGFPELHIHITRIPISEVPEDPEEIKTWIHQRFQTKDRLLDDFFSPDKSLQNSFGANKVNSIGQLKSVLPSTLMFVAFSLSFFGTGCGLWLYSRVWMFATVGGYVYILAGL